MDENESGVVDAPTFDLVTTVVDAPYFTKATWRPSKQRRLVKRLHAFGGATVAPPAFLEAAKRTQFKKGRPGHRVCSATQKNGKPCSRLAMRGMLVCESHGGAYASPGRAGCRSQAAPPRRSPPRRRLCARKCPRVGL